MKITRPGIGGILFFIIGLLCAGCTPSPQEVHLNGRTMGTTYNVKYVVEQSTVDSSELQSKIDGLLEQVNDQMSTYRPDSELSRFNQSREAIEFVPSKELIKVLKEAKRLGAMSDGYLDVTVGPLVNLWGFGPQAEPETVPDKEKIDRVRSQTGLGYLHISDTGMSKSLPELYVDLSTIAKGFGVDQVAELLEQQGVSHYLVEIGGEMRVSGVKASGKAWRIAIEKPVSNERAAQRIISVGDNAVATAGDYRNYYVRDGQRYSHLIDPKTGYPIQHNLVSVTVLHPSSMTADGLATAINVMGAKRGMAMARSHHLAVLLITKENGEFKEYTTPEFESFLQK